MPVKTLSREHLFQRTAMDWLRRPLAVNVLDRRLVAPGELLARQTEDGGNRVAIFRARCPAAHDDRQDALLIDAAPLRKLPDVEALFVTELDDVLKDFSHGLI